MALGHNSAKRFLLRLCLLTFLSTCTSEIIFSVQNPDPLSNYEEFYCSLSSSPQPFKAANTSSYKSFKNTSLTYKVLSELDVYKPITEEDFQTKLRLTRRFDQVLFGLKPDNKYCDKHRAYVLEHPEAIFDKMSILFTATDDTYVRSKAAAADSFAQIVNLNNNEMMPSNEQSRPLYDIDPSTTCFFTDEKLYLYFHFGQQFSCLSQTSNNIPGSVYLARKDRIAEAAIDYQKLYQDRPQCPISQGKYFLESYVMQYPDQCREFFKLLDSDEYKQLKKERRIVFVRKVTGVHRGEGVEPINEEEEVSIRKTYQNGKLCGELFNGNVMQKYVHNPLLLRGRKFDFRIFMLIASTNPVIAYYHDGMVRVSLLQYDVNSDDKKVLLTNIALNKQIYSEAQQGNYFKGMDEETLKVEQQWNLQRLQEELLKTGVISDPNWLDNYLRPEFKRLMIHLIRMTQFKLFKKSSAYELFGMDFILDEDLNLWFIEANLAPTFYGFPKSEEPFITKMLRDHFEIVHGLLRSRMKRALTYVNKLIEQGVAYENKDGGITITDLESRRKDFEDITRNYFDIEFAPSPTNGFAKIIDENYKGADVYQGLLTEDCL